jgi:hypothetical protein
MFIAKALHQFYAPTTAAHQQTRYHNSKNTKQDR